MTEPTDRSDRGAAGEELLRTMAERLAQMFENMRYAEAGVLVQRYVAGLAETTGDGRDREEAPRGGEPLRGTCPATHINGR